MKKGGKFRLDYFGCSQLLSLLQLGAGGFRFESISPRLEGEDPRSSLLLKVQPYHLLFAFLGKFLNVMVATALPTVS